MKLVKARLIDLVIRNKQTNLVHRSWLVNSQHTTVEGSISSIIYCGAKQVSASRYQKEDVRQKILYGKLLRKE